MCFFLKENLGIFKRYHTLHHHHHHGYYYLLWVNPVKYKRKDTQHPQWRVFQSRAGKNVCQFLSSMISYQFHGRYKFKRSNMKMLLVYILSFALFSAVMLFQTVYHPFLRICLCLSLGQRVWDIAIVPNTGGAAKYNWSYYTICTVIWVLCEVTKGPKGVRP